MYLFFEFCKTLRLRFIIIISSKHGGDKEYMYEFKQFKSLEEGIAALSDQKTDPDALAQLADPNENMCLFLRSEHVLVNASALRGLVEARKRSVQADYL